jgi:hypothetical protein
MYRRTLFPYFWRGLDSTLNLEVEKVRDGCANVVKYRAGSAQKFTTAGAPPLSHDFTVAPQAWNGASNPFVLRT